MEGFGVAVVFGRGHVVAQLVEALRYKPDGRGLEGFGVAVVFGRGHVVAQLVEALRYKPDGRGLDSRWCHKHFSWT